MKVSTLAIMRYRAFDQRFSIPLSDLTVLTGSNNLGESTVLSAMRLLFAPVGGYAWHRETESYRYDEDYPKCHVGRRGRRWPTRIAAEVECTGSEQSDGQGALGPTGLPERVELSVELGHDRDRTVARYAVQPGPRNDDEQQSLVRWIPGRTRFVYMPANRSIDDVRTTVLG